MIITTEKGDDTFYPLRDAIIGQSLYLINDYHQNIERIEKNDLPLFLLKLFTFIFKHREGLFISFFTYTLRFFYYKLKTWVDSKLIIQALMALNVIFNRDFFCFANITFLEFLLHIIQLHQYRNEPHYPSVFYL